MCIKKHHTCRPPARTKDNEPNSCKSCRISYIEKNIIRLVFELRAELGLQTEGKINQERVKSKLKEKHLEAWRNIPMHSYVFKKVDADKDIDSQASHNWMNMGISSHAEGHVIALQEPPSNAEIRTGTMKQNVDYAKVQKRQYFMY